MHRRACNVPRLVREWLDRLGHSGKDAIDVCELRWGSEDASLLTPVDFIVASDVVYNVDVVDDLVEVLCTLSHASTRTLIAYGVNRQGEDRFTEAAKANGFEVARVMEEDQHPLYHSSQITFLELRKTGPAPAHE